MNMKTRALIVIVASATSLLASAKNPIGDFDFNLRGATPAEQIHSLDGIGFDGIAMPLNSPKDLERLDAYQKAAPDLRLFAGLVHLQADKPEAIPWDHVRKASARLAGMNAKMWLIIGGTKGNDAKIQTVINQAADIAAGDKVGVSLYPHDHTAVETAEEMLVYLKRADRPNLTISVHLCHEMRAGNKDRLDAVVAAVGPLMDIVTISGSDSVVNDNSTDWSDAIKPFGEGDFDPKIFLRVLKAAKFEGPIILHTFGLQKKPDGHYRKSFLLYQKMRAEVDAAKP